MFNGKKYQLILLKNIKGTLQVYYNIFIEHFLVNNKNKSNIVIKFIKLSNKFDILIKL